MFLSGEDTTLRMITQVLWQGHTERYNRRLPNDAVRMFKTLILRELGQVSDEYPEYQILGRLSSQRFWESGSVTMFQTQNRSGINGRFSRKRRS